MFWKNHHILTRCHVRNNHVLQKHFVPSYRGLLLVIDPLKISILKILQKASFAKRSSIPLFSVLYHFSLLEDVFYWVAVPQAKMLLVLKYSNSSTDVK
ncbi:hypothetical protein C0J52_13474 [Blattella germanica]|nr:hypothetical protein C0J52_13474 [Blattella germanica]